MVFGGDGEGRIDPDIVEVLWPGYDDGFDDSGYVVTGLFDPLPDISGLVSYGSFWYSSSVLLDDDLIMTCGGGYPAMKKCFGLDLNTGSWSEMAEMNYGRTEGHFLVKIGNGVMAIGGSSSLQIEIYNRDFDIWMKMPDWELQESISGRCPVALNEFQVMLIGGTPLSMSTSMILDIRTGIWTKTEPILTPRYAHACLLTEVNGVVGVMVTGKNDHVIDRKQIQLFVKYKRYHLQ